MLIDERIEELSTKEAKRLLREATEKLSESMACEACAMKIACGLEPTDDDCMHRVLSMLCVAAGMTIQNPPNPDADQDDEPKEAVVYYDPRTMRIQE